MSSGRSFGAYPYPRFTFCLGAVALLAALSASASQVSAGCNTLNIGSGARTWEYPFTTSYDDSRTQSIYLASEVGTAGSITALALNIITAPGQTMQNFTIRMKHTPLNTYSSAYLDPSSGFTVVYQANETITSTGWRTFTFMTPFPYNPSNGTQTPQNLMIDFSFNNASYSSAGICAAWQPGVYRSVTKTAYSNMGDPLTWSSTSYAARNMNLPQVQLTICGANPFNFSFSSRTADSITWSWMDTATDEDGYYGHDASQNLMWSVPVNSISYEETSLLPNTQYTRHLHAYTGALLSTPSDNVSVYTLPAAPNVTCNRHTGCPAYAVNTTFTFSNAISFGGSGVNHYHYVWDQNPTLGLTGSEAIWSSGTITSTANQTGQWFLHVMSHNVEHASGGTVDYGPYVIGQSRFDFDADCDVDLDDMDILYGCSSGASIPQTNPACADLLLDADDDVDMDDFAIFQRCWSGEGNLADLTCGN